MFGAPLGGYARSSRSRIAALPLRLVGGGAFDLPEVGAGVAAGGGDGEVGGGGDGRGKASGGASEGGRSSAAKRVPHFQISDDGGRRFVCRPYHEDELEPTSVLGSAFDAPVLRAAPLNLSDDDGEEEDDDYDTYDHGVQADGIGQMPMDAIQVALNAAAAGDFSDGNWMEADGGDGVRVFIKVDANAAGAGGGGDGNSSGGGGGSGGGAAGPSSKIVKKKKKPKPLVVVKPKDITRQLDKLDGLCLRIHQGWWSYEWCHGVTVTQFHVKVEEEEEEKASESAVSRAKVDIESITSLGRYSSRKVRMDHGKGGMPHGGHGGTPQSGAIVITETFSDGEWCEEASVHRSTEVEIRCCPETEEDRDAREVSRAALNARDDHRVLQLLAVLKTVSELKDEVCKYKVNICSPLLCRDAFAAELDEDEEEEEEEEEDAKKDGVGREPVAAGDGVINNDATEDVIGQGGEMGDVGATLTASKVVEPFPHDDMITSAEEPEMTEETKKRRRRRNDQGTKKKESIREILDRTLGNHCLQRNAGWCVYPPRLVAIPFSSHVIF